MKQFLRGGWVVAALLLGSLMATGARADPAVATINAQKILATSRAAKEAFAKFQADFTPREKELSTQASTLKEKTAALDKMAPTLSPTELVEKQREINALTHDFQRKQQAFAEDRDARRRTDIQGVLALANQAVKKIAQAAKLDYVTENFVYASAQTDITDQVIAAMDSAMDK